MPAPTQRRIPPPSDLILIPSSCALPQEDNSAHILLCPYVNNEAFELPLYSKNDIQVSERELNDSDQFSLLKRAHLTINLN